MNRGIPCFLQIELLHRVLIVMLAVAVEQRLDQLGAIKLIPEFRGRQRFQAAHHADVSAVDRGCHVAANAPVATSRSLMPVVRSMVAAI